MMQYLGTNRYQGRGAGVDGGGVESIEPLPMLAQQVGGEEGGGY